MPPEATVYHLIVLPGEVAFKLTVAPEFAQIEEGVAVTKVGEDGAVIMTVIVLEVIPTGKKLSCAVTTIVFVPILQAAAVIVILTLAVVPEVVETVVLHKLLVLTVADTV